MKAAKVRRKTGSMHHDKIGGTHKTKARMNLIYLRKLWNVIDNKL